MNDLIYLPSRQIKPIVRLMVERHEFGELIFTEQSEVTPETVESSLLLLLYGVHPSLSMMEDKVGNAMVLNGGRYVQAIIEFVNDQHRYPSHGRFSSFQGKCFSELTRTDQRKIEMAELSITLCSEESQLFTELSHIAKQLS